MTQNTRWIIIAVAVVVIVAVVGVYFWQSRPAPIPPAPTATLAAAPTAAPTGTPEAAAQPESPLEQPVSPLEQPESPLTTLNGKEIVANPKIPIDRAALVNLVASTAAPEPQEGMAAVSAVLFSYSLNVPVNNTAAYLTPADIVDGTPVPPSIYLGPKSEAGDVSGHTNDQGQLLLDNIPPGDYYLIVWTVYDWPAAFTSPEESLPVRISVEAGNKLDLGLLYVQWP